MKANLVRGLSACSRARFGEPLAVRKRTSALDIHETYRRLAAKKVLALRGFIFARQPQRPNPFVQISAFHPQRPGRA
jgi:hypothetical protein